MTADPDGAAPYFERVERRLGASERVLARGPRLAIVGAVPILGLHNPLPGHEVESVVHSGKLNNHRANLWRDIFGVPGQRRELK